MSRLVRYADDFVVLVSGTEAQAEALKVDVAAVLSTMGLRLSVEKTGVCHINEGFDFLGMRVQRKPRRGSSKVFVYSWPAKKALASAMMQEFLPGSSDPYNGSQETRPASCNGSPVEVSQCCNSGTHARPRGRALLSLALLRRYSQRTPPTSSQA